MFTYFQRKMKEKRNDFDTISLSTCLGCEQPKLNFLNYNFDFGITFSILVVGIKLLRLNDVGFK